MSTDDSTPPTRRKVLGKIGTGLAFAFATPALARQTATPTTGARPPAQSIVRDPVTQYVRPPFAKQTQPWPGLASKMVPPPDHGEKSYQGTGRLTGRRALITGGDSGIGRAVAIAFAREGADVAINYLPAEESDAREVVALIRAAGRKAVAIPGDIRSEAFCQQLVAQAARELGGLDILVNNAARQHSVDSILDLTTEQFDWTLKTNLYAMFWITKAALPHFQPGAAIINTASEQAYDPSPNLLDYAQTKAAIVNFSKSLARQLAHRGIRVNAVAPGPIWTPLQPSGGQKPDKLPTFGADTPMGRPGQPAELAPAYVTLASQESSYATGQVYGVNGGNALP
ncbi:SDR family oxidoreductase (plasmid) [Deinococcus sp. KNUC1210]|uniref:SDR family oxidoreductase n=1 Tax=Deinococcus sp. KNUC1210 TaxID=2917691 RepID=UPI001EF02961|nr:SDR family oxidoreductase [Deinococcus sp. KNUC1210]ULH17253.1 SDR family oxidoreductase [Deinococcus sp. KNUC1210]